MERRQLLQLGALGLGLWGLPAPSRAATGGRKFLFVFGGGGWDPTRVLAPVFDNPAVDLEIGAERGSAGGLGYVSHPARPSVDAFFAAWGGRSVIVNGMLVRSISHEICTMIAMTGTTAGTAPDWPAILAEAERERVLPQLVLGGPSFPGPLGGVVARSGAAGQLEALVSGNIATWSDMPVSGPSHAAEAIMDRYLARRVPARAAGARSARDAALSGAASEAFTRAQALKDLQYRVNLTAGASLSEQGAAAIDAFGMGVSRCVMLGQSTGQWDTHANNDALQSDLWEGLFAGLGQLMQQLQQAPGEVEASLADETVVVVLSEMGRTPRLNGVGGKDHWPYTSALLIGPGLDGGRVIGGFDESFYGNKVDPATGEEDAEGQTLSAEALGATLLALGDVDPGPYVSGVQPIEGVLR